MSSTDTRVRVVTGPNPNLDMNGRKMTITCLPCFLEGKENWNLSILSGGDILRDGYRKAEDSSEKQIPKSRMRTLKILRNHPPTPITKWSEWPSCNHYRRKKKQEYRKKRRPNNTRKRKTGKRYRIRGSLPTRRSTVSNHFANGRDVEFFRP